MIDIDQYKPKLETLLSQSTGLDWSIKGDVDLSLWPFLSVTINDIQATNDKENVLEAGSAKIEIELFPLLSREIRISTFAINSPNVTIVKDEEGNLNIPSSPKGQESPADIALPINLLILEKLKVADGTLVFSDKKSGNETRLSLFDFEIGSFTIVKNNRIIDDFQEHIKKSELSGQFRSESLSTNKVDIENISFMLSGNDSIFTINPINFIIHDGEALGDLTIDMTSSAPTAMLDFTLAGYDIGGFFKDADGVENIVGALDLTTKVTTKGLTQEELVYNLNGSITFQGNNLIFKKFDFDALLHKFEKSQNFSLVDFGGFFLLGPLGPLLTKSYDYTKVYLETGEGQSTITHILGDWQIENGIATTRDVAFATKENRVAIQGEINFVEKQYDQLKVAILDGNGCAKLSQEINGPFSSPEMEEAGLVAKTIVNPVVSLFKKATKVFKEEKCQPFYSGQVLHPSSK